MINFQGLNLAPLRSVELRRAGLPREARKAKRGGGGGSRIRHTAFSANSDMSGFPLNFKAVRPFLSIFNKQNKFNNSIQNQNFLHQIYTKFTPRKKSKTT